MVSQNNIFCTPAVRIRVLRIALEIKQISFAYFLKICTNTLRNWEQTGYTLPMKTRDRLKYVGINPQWLEYGIGDPFEYDLDTVREKIMFALKQK
jgi:DNA-binding transcriptional regulator YiaG